MGKVVITKSNLDFLKLLKNNNNRDWFNANKDRYLEEQANLIAFADDLLHEMQKHDNIETASGKASLFRIYRDTRFSKDKTPYKTHYSGHFKRATKKLRGGYYFHIDNDGAFVGGGFWAPNPPDLKRIRDEIAYDAEPLKKILKSKSFKSNFGQLDGEKVKTSPKGFSADHPEIDLLRYKQFLISRNFSKKEVLSKDFGKEINKTFKAMRPFFDFMSQTLTTDLNGISIV